MPTSSRIIMLGTGDFALPTFLHLLETGHHVITLITQPDRPQGRKQQLIAAPIKQAALERGIPVYQPEDVNAAETVAQIRTLQPDLLVTAAYGQILSAELLGVPKRGGINLHGSVLPAYRGAAPVARAIERGETTSGVTVILMNPRVDAGGMVHVATTPIDPDETAGELEDRLAVLGAPLVAQTIAELEAGTATILPQEKAKVTRAPKLRKEDGLIAWNKPAQAIHNLVRAMQPWPLSCTTWTRPGHEAEPPLRIIVHRTRVVDDTDSGLAPGTVLDAGPNRLVVAAAPGSVELVTVQVPGKKPMPAADFLRGHAVKPGNRLGDS